MIYINSFSTYSLQLPPPPPSKNNFYRYWSWWIVIKIYERFLPGINLEFLGIYYRNEQIIQ